MGVNPSLVETQPTTKSAINGILTNNSNQQPNILSETIVSGNSNARIQEMKETVQKPSSSTNPSVNSIRQNNGMNTNISDQFKNTQLHTSQTNGSLPDKKLYRNAIKYQMKSEEVLLKYYKNDYSTKYLYDRIVKEIVEEKTPIFIEDAPFDEGKKFYVYKGWLATDKKTDEAVVCKLPRYKGDKGVEYNFMSHLIAQNLANEFSNKLFLLIIF